MQKRFDDDDDHDERLSEILLRDLLLSPTMQSAFGDTQTIAAGIEAPEPSESILLLALGLLRLLQVERRQADGTTVRATTCVLTRLVRVGIHGHAVSRDVDALVRAVAEVVRGDIETGGAGRRDFVRGAVEGLLAREVRAGLRLRLLVLSAVGIRAQVVALQLLGLLLGCGLGVLLRGGEVQRQGVVVTAVEDRRGSRAMHGVEGVA